ncbi:MAG: type IV pili twitching motility protein PilT, partial [Phycisphaerae bacterium]|nr:type IV pili twitching motility protein PilT [Phycisphaerae bacterium]
MIDINKMLAKSIEYGASDVHINTGMPPIMRIHTELVAMDMPEVSEEEAKRMVISLTGEDKFKTFEDKKDLDFSTTIDDGHRFRVNAHYQRDTIALSFRVISNVIPPLEDLHLP